MDSTKTNQSHIYLIIVSICSNFFEFYEFMLFPVLTIPLTQAFFIDSSITNILNSLLIFATAFVMRPIGALFFGYLGDNRGRKYSLTLSTLTMGIATFSIGCLPSYNQIGSLATILLVVCRLLQGFSLGGESNGSFIFLLEHIKRRQAIAGASVIAGAYGGMVFAMLQGAILTRPDMPYFAWRIPFWIGGIIVLISFYMRLFLAESDIFIRLQLVRKSNTAYKRRSLMTLRKHYVPFICTIGIGGVCTAFAYTLTTYLNIYLHHFAKYTLSQSLWYLYFGLIITVILILLMGYLADKFSPAVIMQVGSIIGMLGAVIIPYCLIYNAVLTAIVILALIISAFNAPVPAFVNNLFPDNIKYTAISVGCSIGVAIFGGICPLGFVFLTEKFNSPFAITIPLLLTSIIALLSVQKAVECRSIEY